MIPRRPHRIPPFALALALTTFVVSACEKAPFLAPTGSTITLTSPISALPTDGTAIITAQVLEASGTPPHSGTRVTFTTTLGTIEPAEVSTDASGRANVTFRAGGASGVAIIAASSGGATTSAGGAPSSTNTGGTTTGTTGGGDRNLRIAVGAAAVGRIILGASPSIVSANGDTPVRINASVIDINGNPLPGVAVVFTTTGGALSVSSMVSDTQGAASTTLNTTVEATVTASAGLGGGATGGGGSTGGSGGNGGSTGGTSGSASASVTIKVNPVPTLSIVPATTGALTAGTPVAFTITVTVPTGSTAQVRQLTINFGDGTVQNLGASSGTLSVQHVYNNTAIQTYTVTVTLTDTQGSTITSSTVVVVLPQPPLGVGLTFTKVGAALPVSVNFTATITPATATVSSYVWDFGDGQSQTTTTNTATKTYTTAGTFTVRVTVTTTTGQTTTGTVAVAIP